MKLPVLVIPTSGWQRMKSLALLKTNDLWKETPASGCMCERSIKNIWKVIKSFFPLKSSSKLSMTCFIENQIICKFDHLFKKQTNKQFKAMNENFFAHLNWLCCDLNSSCWSYGVHETLYTVMNLSLTFTWILPHSLICFLSQGVCQSNPPDQTFWILSSKDTVLLQQPEWIIWVITFLKVWDVENGNYVWGGG